MPAYLVTITMPDGSQGVHHGIYADGFVASQEATDAFPEAKRISAKPLVPRCAHARPIAAAPGHARRAEGERA